MPGKSDNKSTALVVKSSDTHSLIKAKECLLQADKIIFGGHADKIKRGSKADQRHWKIAFPLLHEAYSLGAELKTKHYYELAQCYLYGDGVNVHLVKYKLHLLKAAALGSSNAQNDAGDNYQFGRHGFIQDKDAAQLYYKKAADKNHAEAQASLQKITSSAALCEEKIERDFENRNRIIEQKSYEYTTFILNSRREVSLLIQSIHATLMALPKYDVPVNTATPTSVTKFSPG